MVLSLLLGSPLALFAGAPGPDPLTSNLPDASLSVVRVFGALALVLGLFLGGVWLFRNWQRLLLQKGRTPRLNVLEMRSLGQRHALYVIAFEQQRFLVASSPTGVNLLSHLPLADAPAEIAAPPNVTPVSFGQILHQVLARK